MTVNRKLIIAGIILVYGCLLLIYSTYRVIDGDEGYYASAVRLVTEGKIPYLDFFYPQAPLLPFVYGAWSSITGYSLYALRFFSSLLTVATVVLWAWYLFKQYGRKPWTAFPALIIVLINPYLASWGVTTKTYALGNFLLTAALIAVWLGESAHHKTWYCVAGVASGLLVSSRLFYFAVPLVLVGWLVPRNSPGRRIRRERTGWYLLGFIMASIPSIVLFLNDPELLVFNNIGFHLLISTRPQLTVWLGSAANVLLNSLTGHWFMILQLGLFLTGISVLFGKGRSANNHDKSLPMLALLLTLAYVSVTLIPYPSYEQYLTSPLTPLFAPIVVLGIQRLGKTSRFPVLACCLGAVSLTFVELRNENRSQVEPCWKLPNYYDVTRHIRESTSDVDTVLSLWPGYVCESRRRYIPGMENHFGLLAAGRLTREQEKQYHIAGTGFITDAIAAEVPKMVIVGAEVGMLTKRWGIDPSLQNFGSKSGERFFDVLNEHYELSAQVGGVDVYSRRQQSPNNVE